MNEDKDLETSALMYQRDQEARELHTREHSTCANCTNFMIPPEGQNFGWCLEAEDYVHELDREPAVCEAFDARESR